MFTISKIKQSLEEKLHASDDFTDKSLTKNGHSVPICYIGTLCDHDLINKFILLPFYEFSKVEDFVNYIQALPSTKEITTLDDAVTKLFQGNLLLFFNEFIFSIDVENLKKSVSKKQLLKW